MCVYKIQNCGDGAEVSLKFEEIVQLLNLESDRKLKKNSKF